MINNSFNIAGGGGGEHPKSYVSCRELLKEHKTLEEPLTFINAHLRWELLECRHFIKTVYFNILRLQTAE